MAIHFGKQVYIVRGGCARPAGKEFADSNAFCRVANQIGPTASACAFQRCAFTPNTRSQKISDAAPRMAKIAIKGNRRLPSGGYKKVSQPKPPSTDNTPRIRGRKVDLIMR